MLTSFPEQLTYELILPVVLFGQSPAERARLNGAPERTLYRQVARFETQGMASLFGPSPATHQRPRLEIRQAILEPKAEHPGLDSYEITTICWVRFGHRPSPPPCARCAAAPPPHPRLVRRPFQRRPFARRQDRIHRGASSTRLPAYLLPAMRVYLLRRVG